MPMPPQINLVAELTATCCSTLQYLEGAAYIAVVLAVLGVPQLLTYYLDQRNRSRDRKEDRVETERVRQEERAEAERVRREERAEAERVRREEQAEAERVRREEQAEGERVRREERAEAERRHLEVMTMLTGAITALTAIVDRNGHTSPNQSGIIEQLQQRIAELEAENSQLRPVNGNGLASDNR